MAYYNRGRNKFSSFFASILMGVVILIIAATVVVSFAEDGIWIDLITQLMDAVPFGSQILSFAVGIVSNSISLSGAIATMNPVKMTPGYFFHDFLLLTLTSVLFEVFRNFGNMLMGLTSWDSKKKCRIVFKGRWLGAKAIINSLVCSVLAAVIASIFLTKLGNLLVMGSKPQTIFSILSTIVTLIGSFGIGFFLFGTIAQAVVFVGFRLVLINSFIVIIQYFIMFVCLIFLQNPSSFKLIGVMLPSALLLMILLTGLGLMIDSVFSV